MSINSTLVAHELQLRSKLSETTKQSKQMFKQRSIGFIFNTPHGS